MQTRPSPFDNRPINSVRRCELFGQCPCARQPDPLRSQVSGLRFPPFSPSHRASPPPLLRRVTAQQNILFHLPPSVACLSPVSVDRHGDLSRRLGCILPFPPRPPRPPRETFPTPAKPLSRETGPSQHRAISQLRPPVCSSRLLLFHPPPHAPRALQSSHA